MAFFSRDILSLFSCLTDFLRHSSYFEDAVRFADQFDDGEQHDCQEFVSFLIERFHTCVARIEHENCMENGSEGIEPEAELSNTRSAEKDSSEENMTDEEKGEKVR